MFRMSVGRQKRQRRVAAHVRATTATGTGCKIAIRRRSTAVGQHFIVLTSEQRHRATTYPLGPVHACLPRQPAYSSRCRHRRNTAFDRVPKAHHHARKEDTAPPPPPGELTKIARHAADGNSVRYAHVGRTNEHTVERLYNHRTQGRDRIRGNNIYDTRAIIIIETFDTRNRVVVALRVVPSICVTTSTALVRIYIYVFRAWRRLFSPMSGASTRRRRHRCQQHRRTSNRTVH